MFAANVLLGVVTASNVPTEPVVLDNMDSTVVKDMKNAFAGSYQPCMEDAYQGQFHHDWARNKGSALFTYKFMPPADGCYSVEEYHPGKNPSCSRYLPTNAHLDIDYCKGKSAAFEVNQATKGGQWNQIVSGLMFYKGIEGRLTMKNHQGEVCGMGGDCFWIADAFRLTYKGPSCNDGTMPSGGASAESATTTGDNEAVRPSQKESEQVQATAANVATESAVMQETATVTLRLSLGEDLDKDGVTLKIQEHKPHLEKTLAVHLGYKSASIVEVTASGRRLLDDRSSQMSLLVRFSVQEKLRTPSSQETFQQALQSDFNNIVPGVTIEAVSNVEWLNSVSKEGTTDNDSDSTTMHLVLALVCGMLVFIGVGSFCLWRCLSSRRKTKIPTDSERSVVKPCEETIIEGKNVVSDKDLEKAEKFDYCDTGSTGTPSSEPPASLDGINSETNSMMDEDVPTVCVVPTA